MKSVHEKTVAVVGLGYVGLPLALAFGRKMNTIGFDISEPKLAAYRQGVDPTGEMEAERFQFATRIVFTSNAADLSQADFLVVAVPTPIDDAKQPDLTPVVRATEAIAPHLKPGAIIVYESTVYPGVTDDVCAPLLERISGKKRGEHFKLGYSPERINPGDKEHRVTTIKKVTAGSTPEAADLVDALYREIIVVGTHKAPSIRIAEAAKVIENTQRDVNIALINELALIFNKMGIDTEAVLQAAGTKWNFLPFRPGLVGGHCIGVDPYYLTHKAQSIGYHPEIILAGRRLNDNMGAYVVSQLVKSMTKRRIHVNGARVLVLGLTFKENCPDLRNTRVVDILKELSEYNVKADVFDPWIDGAEAEHEYGIIPVSQPEPGAYDAVIIAVAHHQFKALGAEGIRAFGKPNNHVLYDLKYVLDANQSDLRL